MTNARKNRVRTTQPVWAMGTQSISVNVLKDGRENTAKSVSQKLGERRRDQLKKNRIQKDKEGKWGTGA